MIRALFRLLVALTPPSFPEEARAEILEVQSRRHAGLRGPVARFRFDAREAVGMLGLLLGLWWREWRARGPRVSGADGFLGSVAQDLRLSLRGLWTHKAFSLMVLVVIGLGIGATSAIFSAANAFLFRPLPFNQADRLVRIYETNPEFGWTHGDAAPANALDWRDQVEAFDDLTLYTEWVSDVTLVKDGEPSLHGVTSISGNFFDVLGVEPALGRSLTWAETWEGNDDVVVISHSFWEEYFGGDPGVIGRTVEFGGSLAQVVGVMPAGFAFPRPEVEIWAPWGWNPQDREAVWFRRAHWVYPVARLAPGATVEEARAQLQVVVERLQADYPETNRVMGAGLMPLRSFLIREVRAPLTALLGSVGLLLLLACINVANLMLVRSAERTREVSLRYALGAQPLRVVQWVLTESITLSILGGVIGLVIGWVGVRLVATIMPLGIAGATGLELDHRVVLFTLGVAVLSGVVVGLVPAIRAATGNMGDALKEGGRSGTPGRRSSRTVNFLVAGEVALAFLVVVGAGLMGKSFAFLRNVNPGFNTEATLAVQFTLPSGRYPGRDQVIGFYDQLQERLEGSYGIERVGTVSLLPLSGTSWSSQFKAETWGPDRVGFEILHRRADQGYFEAMGTPLIRGRMFDETDGPDDLPVVVINQTFAEEHFPGENPIGQRIAYDREPDENSAWYEIVGIVADQYQVSPGQPPRAEVFENRNQDWGRDSWVVLRTAGDPMMAVPVIREALRDMDPLIALSSVLPLREVWSRSMAGEQFLLVLFSAFGIVALILAAAGVYGVTAQAGKRRTQEIGIRMAVGAAKRQVLALLVGQGLATVGVGLVVGIGLSVFVTRLIATLIFGVRPTDPGTIVSVVLLLGGVAAVASFVPALRASQADPVESLRSE